MTTVLLVPITGPLRIVPTDDASTIVALIAGEGRFVDFGVKDGDDEIGRVGFRVIEGPQSINMRARYILAQLTGVHMVVTGTAAFSDLPSEKIQRILTEYT